MINNNSIDQENNKSYGLPVKLYKNGSISYDDKKILMPKTVFVCDLVKEKQGILAALLYGHMMHYCRGGKPFNASHGITALKLRMSRETARRNERILISAGLINKSNSGDITPNITNEFSRYVLGFYIDSYSDNHSPVGRKAIKYAYDLTILPILVSGRESIKYREVAYCNALLEAKIANMHSNKAEDFKYSPQTYKQLALMCGVSAPTAKTICDRLSELKRFYKVKECKTLILYAAAKVVKSIKVSISNIKSFLLTQSYSMAIDEAEQREPIPI